MTVRIEGYIEDHDTDDTLQAMIDYAQSGRLDPKIMDLAEMITAEIHPEDHRSQMIAILNWINANMTFVEDDQEAARLFGTTGDVELVKGPSSVLETRRYDCDCIATFIAALIMSLGIPARFVVVGFSSFEMTGPEGLEHVYAQGYDNATGSWLIIDPVAWPNERQMTLDTCQAKTYDIR